MNKKMAYFVGEAAEETEDRHWWERPLLRLVMIWLVWTIIGLFFTFQLYLATLRGERPIPFSYAIFTQLTDVYIWALVTPLVLWLAHHFPVDRHSWRRNLSLHALFSIITTIFVLSTFSIINYLHFARPAGKAFSFVPLLRTIAYNSSENLATYWIILLIVHAFSYYNRYRKGEVRASQLEAQLSHSQLQALKMQLQPHFLFNTLHSISALLNKDTEAARKMITRLGDFLRLTLANSGAQEVTLQREMEFLMCYLEIERIRFHDRLTTHVHVDPQALDVRVPNLILQPIVENAIRHGIAPRSTPGEIEIQAKQTNGLLRIEVRDNGPGLFMNRSGENQFQKGLGLANTQSRLEHLYGDAHRFELTNDPDGGLIVTLEIPSRLRDRRDDLNAN